MLQTNISKPSFLLSTENGSQKLVFLKHTHGRFKGMLKNEVSNNP